MPVTPADVHAVGEALASGKPLKKEDEATIRAAFGRLYYSVYHTFRSALRTALATPTLDVGHDEMVAYLIGSGRQTLTVTCAILKPLKALREKSDYILHEVVLRSELEAYAMDAQGLVAKQAEFVTAMKGLPRPDMAPWMVGYYQRHKKKR